MCQSCRAGLFQQLVPAAMRQPSLRAGRLRTCSAVCGVEVRRTLVVARIGTVYATTLACFSGCISLQCKTAVCAGTFRSGWSGGVLFADHFLDLYSIRGLEKQYVGSVCGCRCHNRHYAVHIPTDTNPNPEMTRNPTPKAPKPLAQNPQKPWTPNPKPQTQDSKP